MLKVFSCQLHIHPTLLWTGTLRNHLSSQRNLNWRQLSIKTRDSNGAPRRGWESRQKKRHATGPLPDRPPEASARVRVEGGLSTRHRPPGAGPRGLRYVSGGGLPPGPAGPAPLSLRPPCARRPCPPKRYATAPGPATAALLTRAGQCGYPFIFAKTRSPHLYSFCRLDRDMAGPRAPRAPRRAGKREPKFARAAVAAPLRSGPRAAPASMVAPGASSGAATASAPARRSDGAGAVRWATLGSGRARALVCV